MIDLTAELTGDLLTIGSEKKVRARSSRDFQEIACVRPSHTEQDLESLRAYPKTPERLNVM